MSDFTAKHIELTGGFRLAAPPDRIFWLFSPRGEERWVAGWRPELLHPADGGWAEGQVFRTPEQYGDAVWIVARLDRDAHAVSYYRVEPGRYVVRVDVSCRAAGADASDVRVAYVFVGLTGEGNREIAAMTQHEHDAKMERWRVAVGRCLAGGAPVDPLEAR
ncbi:MAG TPA: hypothetical protein VFQ38_12330 [Longimicrobiales bacterium]|nr:hypothetical protein [Longimicrobiales bacterium]